MALGPTPPPIQLVQGLFPVGKVAGAWRWPSTLSSAKIKERVELHLCSPGHSWPVLGWPYLYFTFKNCHGKWYEGVERNGGIAPFIFNYISVWILVVSFTLAFYHRRWGPRRALKGGLVVPQNRSWRFGEEKSCFTCRGMTTRPVDNSARSFVTLLNE
jgi:hypothetical protein